MKLLSLFLILFFSICFPQPHLSGRGRTEALRYIDSLKSNLGVVSAHDTVFFVSEAIDTITYSGVFVLPEGSCTEFPFFSFLPINSFDTSEYACFRNSAGKTFMDSLRFLNSLDIVKYWFEVFAVKGEIKEVRRLGTDINVDFGLPVSSAYYSTGRLVLYINDYCDNRNEKVQLIVPSYIHGIPTALRVIAVSQNGQLEERVVTRR